MATENSFDLDKTPPPSVQDAEDSNSSISKSKEYDDNTINGFNLAGSQIPPSILELILCQVSPEDILNCKMVCHSWNGIIKSKAFWREYFKSRNKSLDIIPLRIWEKPDGWLVPYVEIRYSVFAKNLVENPVETATWGRPYERCIKIDLWESGLTPKILELCLPFKINFFHKFSKSYFGSYHYEMQPLDTADWRMNGGIGWCGKTTVNEHRQSSEFKDSYYSPNPLRYLRLYYTGESREPMVMTGTAEIIFELL